MIKGFYFWLVPICLLSGCSDDLRLWPKNFSLVSGPDGIYRLNNATGEVYRIRNGAMEQVGESNAAIVLEKDSAYKTENKRYIIYRGDGRFENLASDNKAPLAGTNKAATVFLTKEGKPYVIRKMSDADKN